MTELAANKSRLLVLAGILVSTSVLLALMFANNFPDRTWAALNTAKTLYADAVSRMIPVPTGNSRSIEEDRIREVVLRYMIESTVRHVFVEIDGKDPGDKLMAQLADLNPAVKKGSDAECTFRGCFDRFTAERAVVLSVRSIKWSFGDRVEVSCGYHCGPLCGSGGVFEVVRNNGHWEVQSYRQLWVS